MNRLIIITILELFCYIQIMSQQTMMIGGIKFFVETDEEKQVASITDYNYQISEKEYPIKDHSRKFKLDAISSSSNRKRTVIIPEMYKSFTGKEYTITSIGRAAFAGFSNVDIIVIPLTIERIDDYAFFRSSISEINIPASVTKIGNRAFGWCKYLKSIKLPEGITLGENIYSESKKINVDYYAPDLSLVKKTKPRVINYTKPEQEKKQAIVSDVDIDLPYSQVVNENVFVVIIANENYYNVADVDFALNDGRSFRRYCHEVLGIPSENIHSIENATYGQMVEQINWLSRVADVYEGKAKIVVYYSGHGIPNEKDGTAYLLPVDVAGNNTSAAYSLSDLYDTLGNLNTRRTTLFIDACFTGSVRGEGMISSARGIAIKVKEESPLGKLVVFSAAQGDETAYPYREKGHGLFTYFLLKKLKETQGVVDLGTLSDYLQTEVSRKSIVINNKPQKPIISFSPQMSDSWRNLTFY